MLCGCAQSTVIYDLQLSKICLLVRFPDINISSHAVLFGSRLPNLSLIELWGTGIARDSPIVLSASMLCLLDVMEGLNPRQSPRKVVDIDIRPLNRKALDNILFVSRWSCSRDPRSPPRSSNRCAAMLMASIGFCCPWIPIT